MSRFAKVFLASAATLLVAAPTASAACSSVEDKLTSNGAAVEVTCVPPNTTVIDAAESTAGTGGTTKYVKGKVAAQIGATFTPTTPGYPWAGLLAKNGSAQVGNWAPRLKTGEAPKETHRQELEKKLAAAEASAAKLGKEQAEIEKELAEVKSALGSENALIEKIKGELEELPEEESQKEREEREAKEKAEREAREKAEKEAKEKAEREAREKAEKEQKEKEQKEKEEGKELEEPPFTTFHKGVAANGSAELSDLKQLGVNPSVRLENPGSTSAYTKAGIFVVYLLSHKNEGGIKAVDHKGYVKEAEAVHAQNPTDVIEVENEPGGNWFWGPGAESQENATSYDQLLKEVHAAIPDAKIYASFDGGHAGDNAWGEKMLKADPNVVSYVTAFTEHPYDGSGANASSTLVRWKTVEDAHNKTKKPIAITEYGRPLLARTGDSPQSSETQQAAADGAMVKKAKEVGWVLDVEIYGYRGDSSPCYAVFKGNGTPRPAVAAIAGA